RQAEPIALNNLANFLKRLGRLDEASARIAEAVVLCRAIGFRPLEGLGLFVMGEAAADRGADEEAERWLRASRELLETVGMRDGNLAVTLRTLGALLVRTGRREEGRALLD